MGGRVILKAVTWTALLPLASLQDDDAASDYESPNPTLYGRILVTIICA